MHDFGLKIAALTGLSIYEQAGRASGRTRIMVSSLTGGETVIAWESSGYVEQIIREVHNRNSHAMKVKIVAVHGGLDLERVVHEARRTGAKIVIDHTVLYHFYRNCIEAAGHYLADLGAEPHRLGEISGQPPPVAEWMAPRR